MKIFDAFVQIPKASLKKLFLFSHGSAQTVQTMRPFQHLLRPPADEKPGNAEDQSRPPASYNFV